MAIMKTLKGKKISTEPPVETLHYFTRDLLAECCDRGDEWGFNRRLNERVKKLPKTCKFPVADSFPHYHAAFRRVREHVRCVVYLGPERGYTTVDVPKSFFRKLPTAPVNP